MNEIIPHNKNNQLSPFDSGPLTPEKMIEDILMTFRNGIMRSLKISTSDYQETWRPIENEMRHKLRHLAILSRETL